MNDRELHIRIPEWWSAVTAEAAGDRLARELWPGAHMELVSWDSDEQAFTVAERVWDVTQ